MSESLTKTVHAFLRDVADDGLTLSVCGTCMGNHIPDNSRITIQQTGLPLPGDVVVLHSSGRLVVHRVIGIYRWKGIGRVLTRADDCQRPDPAIPLSCVVGRVTLVNGTAFSVSLKARIISAGQFVQFVFARLFLRRKTE